MKKIRLTKEKYALVDDVDFDHINQFRWYAGTRHGCWYASRKSKTPPHKMVWMHREIIETPSGLQTDHINRNGLDNRRSNLRICTASQNQCNRKIQRNNTSGFKGVSFHKHAAKWQAHLSMDGVNYHLGLFNTPEEAAHAYDETAQKLHGEFARLNHV